MGAFRNLTGQKFNRLVALQPIEKDKKGEFLWKCQCDCGNNTKVRSSALRAGRVKSCGCLHKETARKLNFKHGQAGTRLYWIWQDMKKRCFETRNKAYKYYGKKGISICDEWKGNYLIFKKWALTNGYTSSLTIDRINHRGNYEPSNCQWLTLSENTRKARKEKRDGRKKDKL